MNRVWVLLILIYGWAELQLQAQPSSVIITPSSQQIERDSFGYVRIRVNNIQHLHAYNVQVSYNPMVVRCRAVRGLNFFGTLTFFTSMIDSVNGRATVNEAILGSGGQSGSGDLAELSFFALANGTATLAFVVADFRDTVNQSIPVITQGAVIQVSGPNGVQEVGVGVANALHVESYPNPFNPATTIRYRVAEAGEAVVRVYSIMGREVYFKNRFDDVPGTHEFVWNGQDVSGNEVSSGMYVGHVQTAKVSGTTKLLLLR